MTISRQERLEKLTAALRQGDASARDELIKELIKLSYSLAGKFIKRFPQYSEELKAVAVEHLVDKLTQINCGNTLLHDNNIGAFINASTIYALLHWLRKQKKRTDKQVLVSPLIPCSDDKFDCCHPIVYNKATYNLMLEEILTSNTISDREKLYICLRLDGLNDSEAAKVLGINRKRISSFKYTLKKRLHDFL